MGEGQFTVQFIAGCRGGRCSQRKQIDVLSFVLKPGQNMISVNREKAQYNSSPHLIQQEAGNHTVKQDKLKCRTLIVYELWNAATTVWSCLTEGGFPASFLTIGRFSPSFLVRRLEILIVLIAGIVMFASTQWEHCILVRGKKTR